MATFVNSGDAPVEWNSLLIDRASEKMAVALRSVLQLHKDVPEAKKSPHSVNLLGVAVGIKQKELMDKVVKKDMFLKHDFVVILFHYDGVVDNWNDLDWSSRVIHVSAMNQTKWWFAKRFLHPDIVSEYDYIFLWNEDLGVENFPPEQYISIVKEEGLEITSST